jgi:transcriptional regulator with XRE-family HTH domain
MSSEESIFKLFSRNLYNLSVKSGSIAETCRQLGINRQQFNKYLAGTTLPSAATMLKLTKYFGVDQRSLFESEPSQHSDLSPAEASPPDRPLRGAVERRIMSDIAGTQCASLKPGCYSLYFPGAIGAGYFKRSALFIRNVDDLTVFVRLSSGKPQASRRHKIQMRHDGLAIEIDKKIYLVGKNRVAHREISLLSFGEVDLPIQNIFGGLALTIAKWGRPICTRVSAEYIGPWTARRAVIAAVGEFPFDSPEISDELRRSLLAPLKSTEAVLGPYDFFNELRSRYY